MLTTEYLVLHDIKIAYRQNGSGENLLLLHGNSVDKGIFKKYQLDYFSGFHTYAPDSRGHGQSISKDKALSYEQLSMDMIDFCKAKGIDHAAVIGYSDGGNLALWMAIKAPEIFTKVAAISPNILANGIWEGVIRFIQSFINRRAFFARFLEPVRKQVMRFKLMLTDTGITNEELKGIRTKMMILYAERDMVKESHILDFSSLIPGVSLVKIKGCNHLTIPYQKETIGKLQKFLY